MINSFVMIIKLARMNMTAQRLTDILLQSSSHSSSMYCRKCRSSILHKRCDYTRKITDLKNGKWIDYDLKTVRFICEGCSTTHAFLVPLVIPYGRHSVPLVIRALYEYFNTGSAKTVCEKYQITAPTLYRWKKLFLKHKEEWLGYLKDAETSAIQFLKELLHETDFSEFDRQFMQGRTDHKAFLQNHKNADNQQFV